jgi:hypothetical protein
VTLETAADGKIYMRSQATDYALRGAQAETMNMVEFFTNTWETVTTKTTGEEDITGDENRRPGRKPNTRIPYLDGHPSKGKVVRVLRSAGHHTLPDFVGKWFPRADDPDIRPFYCACMLLLLKPWRDIATDLKHDNESWEDALTRFKSTSSKKILDVMENTQYFHECQKVADRDREYQIPDDEVVDGGNGIENAYELGEDGIYDEDDEYTEAGLARLMAEEYPLREELHGQMGVELAKRAHILEDTTRWSVDYDEKSQKATAEDTNNLHRWKQQMTRSEETSLTGTQQQDDEAPRVEQLQEEMVAPSRKKSAAVELLEDVEVEVPVAKLNPDHLKKDQRRAYDIMTWHLDQTLAKAPNLPPLRMVLYGEGGTGKSAVIQTVTDAFAERGASGLLLKASYTGVAASLIQGKTLHSIGKIHVDKNGQISLSDDVKEKLQKFWNKYTYLIIDEHSMISKSFLAKLSRHIGVGKGLDGKPDVSFGGINVILCGDFHQFPPVATARQNALFYKEAPPKASGMKAHDLSDAILGREIYEEFTTVVILKEQMRVVDPVWREFLVRLRYGRVQPEDLQMLRKLIVGSPECPLRDFKKYPWADMRLVTPRHGMRRHWNEAALREHCVKEQKTLFICPAYDRCRGRALTLSERCGLALKIKTSKRSKILPSNVEFAVGAQVLVTQNLDVDIDVTNGARGEVVGIVLDPDKEAELEEGAPVVKLTRMPKYLLVKLTRTRQQKLEGLEEGVIPIEPVTLPVQIDVKLKGGKWVKRSIRRTQFTMTAAYAFTDYRSQGQTIPTLLADVARPPSGRIDLFNLYVTLSRSSGRDTIRLLRDFDDEMFLTQHDPALQIEDDRLERLNRVTEEWWNRMRAGLGRG